MFDNHFFLKKLLKIRYFEQSLDKLFEDQKIFGTYHRCIGQESVAVAFTWFLDNKKDFVVSNHRNHGHYLAFTDKYKLLLDEISGKKSGVSGGKGGSQVLMEKNFYSNGILGSTIAVAVGVAMGFKLKKSKNLVVCFIGDGALGTGVAYESFNIASLYKLPILFILENNGIAQSTQINKNLAGDINLRFDAFGIKNFNVNGDDINEMMNLSKKLAYDIRNNNSPKAVHVKINRLCAHSKGDESNLKKIFKEIRDPLEVIKKNIKKKEYIKYDDQCKSYVKNLIENFDK